MNDERDWDDATSRAAAELSRRKAAAGGAFDVEQARELVFATRRRLDLSPDGKDLDEVRGMARQAANMLLAVCDALAAARAEERRVCVQAMCGNCADGRTPTRNNSTFQWFHTTNWCPASALHERAYQEAGGTGHEGEGR
jgi:hypothetical protein